MKIIDRYIMQSFLVPFAYCFSGFTIIYIIWDLFGSLQEFMQAGTPARQIVFYYLFMIPSILTIIMPASIMLAVLYSLFQLTRHNELTAMRASGVSLARLVTPLIFMGLLASVLVALINETIGPKAAYWTEQFRRQEKHKGKKDVHTVLELPCKNRKGGRDWFIGSFHTQTFEMKNIRVFQAPTTPGAPSYVINAKKAEWVDGSWWFSDLVVQKYDADGNPMGSPKTEMMREMTDFDETPRNFLNLTKNPDFLSARELYEYIQSNPQLSEKAIARYKTILHRRLAMPWTCLVVALIGIPFGTHSARRGALLGITLCLLLFFTYYVVDNLVIALGKTGYLHPALAAWTANIGFLGLSSILIYRMR